MQRMVEHVESLGFRRLTSGTVLSPFIRVSTETASIIISRE
jgi:hypothetical protein